MMRSLTIYPFFALLSPIPFFTHGFILPIRTGLIASHNPIASPDLMLSMTASSSISNNPDLSPGIKAIDEGNSQLLEKLQTLQTNPYFRYYSVDILASCEFMPQELFECYTESCEIYPADEDEVPMAIRKVDKKEYDFDLDGWARWDMPSDDYFDTLQFMEGYTGYDGSEVWNFIHKRICFEGYDYNDDHWKADFNKAVSGLHSMISAQVIKGIQEKVESGEEFSEGEVWRDPNAELARRLGPQGETPLAQENMYFTYMLLLSAVAKAKDRLLQDCASGEMEERCGKDLHDILDLPIWKDPSVKVAAQRLVAHARKEGDSTHSLWEARMRSRELLRIMNCVQCNKCRLHGKISFLGLTTALQILVGRAGEGADPNRIHRVELSALMTTLQKFSRVVDYCQKMQ